MDDRIRQALERDLTIDITTIGRKSGQPRRIEIWFHRVDGEIYLTGSPGRRGWYANLLSNPRFMFHLKGSARADLAALAMPVSDPEQRRRILQPIVRAHASPEDFDRWLAESPLVKVTLEQHETGSGS